MMVDDLEWPVQGMPMVTANIPEDEHLALHFYGLNREEVAQVRTMLRPIAERVGWKIYEKKGEEQINRAHTDLLRDLQSYEGS